MVTRREWLGHALGTAAASGLAPRLAGAQAAADASLILRAIPSTGERLPIIGLVPATLRRSRAKKITRHCAPCWPKWSSSAVRSLTRHPATALRKRSQDGLRNRSALPISCSGRPSSMWPRAGAADAAAARQQIEVSFRESAAKDRSDPGAQHG